MRLFSATPHKETRHTMSTEEQFLTDAELCKRLRISAPTLRKYMKVGAKRGRVGKARDVQNIDRFIVCGKRRWLKESVDKHIHGE